MKLGNAVFYTLEGSRQKYVHALQDWPYCGGAAAILYFLGFAVFRNMNSKLLVESVLSGILGIGTASLYPLYYKRIYITNVCTVYDDLKKAIDINPALAKPDDDIAINKNFGPSKWNARESSMDDDESIELESEIGLFEGDPDGDKDFQRSRVKDML